jgi:hypothetical protein
MWHRLSRCDVTLTRLNERPAQRGWRAFVRCQRAAGLAVRRLPGRRCRRGRRGCRCRSGALPRLRLRRSLRRRRALPTCGRRGAVTRRPARIPALLQHRSGAARSRTRLAADALGGLPAPARPARGRRYKPRAVDNIDEVLRVHVEPRLGRRRITDIRRGEVQQIVDDLAPTMSGSRIRGRQRNPLAVPVGAGTRTGRARPGAARSAAGDDGDADRAGRPAGRVRGAARRACTRRCAPIRARRIRDGPARPDRPAALRGVDLRVGAIEWGVEWEAAKYDASHRVVPCVPPLLALLRRAYIAQGRPRARGACAPLATAPPCCSRATAWPSGRASAGASPGLRRSPCRSAATRLDAAGVSPKVASVLMGHAVPQRQPGAAQVKLARYTHALPEDVERARRQLADYLAATQAQKAARRRVGPYLGPSAGPRRGFSC